MQGTILLVIDAASIGGGQQHVLALAEGLTAQQINVAVACEAQGYLVDELRRRQIVHLPVRLSLRPSIRGVSDIAKAIRACGAKLVHTHGGVAGFYGRLGARWIGGIRTVHTYHGIHYMHDTKLAKRVVHRAIDRLLLRWTDEVICVATSDRDLAIRERLAVPDHVTVIYNGIDHTMFAGSPAHEECGTRRRAPFIVGTVGRLHEQKGQTYLLQAAARVRAAVPMTRFRVIGDGPLRGSLEAEARALGVDEIVEFLGSRNDVPTQLQQFDLFVLPSLWEGLPYVLLEAMAAGLPVVTTEFDGVREIIGGSAEGLVVPPRDPEALADAIIELLRDDRRRADIGLRGAKTVENRFSVSAMIHQTMSVYGDEAIAR